MHHRVVRWLVRFLDVLKILDMASIGVLVDVGQERC